MAATNHSKFDYLHSFIPVRNCKPTPWAWLPLLIVFIGVFSGCSNLAPARAPDRILSGAHPFGVTALAYSQDNRELFTGGHQGEIRRWEASNGAALEVRRGHHSPIRALLPLKRGNLVSGDDDGRLVLWRGPGIAAEVDGAPIAALALFQGRVVSAHTDKRIRVWTTDDLAPVQVLSYTDEVVALSAHANRLAVGLRSSIVLLDADFKPHLRLQARHTPHDLQFSPDGRTLAAGTWFRLQLWDIATGHARSIPTEHNGLVTALAYSPDGRYLATLGRHTDSAIRVHDTADYSVVHRFQAHELCGAALRFSPDGRTLASGSDDESVRFYRMEAAPYSSSGAMPSAH
jgi:WD40 repeat protein